MPTKFTFYQLKRELYLVTFIPPHRQNLIKLTLGRKYEDKEKLENLKLAKICNFEMLEFIEAISEKKDINFSENNFDDDIHPLFTFYSGPDEKEKNLKSFQLDKINSKNLNFLIENVNIVLINEFRSEKKLLVLDLDYTLFDSKTKVLNDFTEVARPGLIEFLTNVYQHYDLVIWSQTTWKYLERK
ncbi:hypothetical protein HK099_002969, partial [Clydaea vesicula]